ncbi:hypothetical protein LTR09_009266 [Extremus antarcticus]|uniref:Uncharacterized protein n=1 Tax=Extremus antarcticus TaxID=702011 RepID=A0AAJ0DGA5_9PEZI|nr:hypothetical protein LTR09_009266 [Extremus antarcticus]
MRYTLSSILIATTCITTSAYALPRPATYSVVNVHGGQTQAALPMTIIQTVTESDSSETTVLVTIPGAQGTATATATVVSIPTTVVETIAHATETALVPEVFGPRPQRPEAGAQETTTVPGPAITPATVPNPEVVTVVSMTTATPTTSYYDNGMWHTSYAIKPVATTLCTSSSTLSGYPSYSASDSGGVPSGAAYPTGSYSGGGGNATAYT